MQRQAENDPTIKGARQCGHRRFHSSDCATVCGKSVMGGESFDFDGSASLPTSWMVTTIGRFSALMGGFPPPVFTTTRGTVEA